MGQKSPCNVFGLRQQRASPHFPQPLYFNSLPQPVCQCLPHWGARPLLPQGQNDTLQGADVQGTQPSFPVTCGVSRHSPGRQLLIATAVPQHFISTGGWSWRAGTSLGVVPTRAGLGSWQKREISALTNRTQGSKPDTPGG